MSNIKQIKTIIQELSGVSIDDIDKPLFSLGVAIAPATMANICLEIEKRFSKPIYSMIQKASYQEFSIKYINDYISQ